MRGGKFHHGFGTWPVRMSRIGGLLLAWSLSALCLAQQVEVRVEGDFPQLQDNAEAFWARLKAAVPTA